MRKTANINVKNAVYRHVNGKIAQLKQQISELNNRITELWQYFLCILSVLVAFGSFRY